MLLQFSKTLFIIVRLLGLLINLDHIYYLALKYCLFFSFIVKVSFKMQVHYYVREDIIVDGVRDINFVIFFVVVKIDFHLMKDGLSIAMLTSRVVGGLSSISVFTTFISMNTMNNVLPIVVFANEENVFVHVPKLVDLQLILKTHF
jgi:hypothetical protein